MKKLIAPVREQSHTSPAPASKYKSIFSSISASVLLGESTSTQISGALGKHTRFPSALTDCGEAHATSAAFTPSAVEIGHSGNTRPSDIRVRSKYTISPWRLP